MIGYIKQQRCRSSSAQLSILSFRPTASDTGVRVEFNVTPASSTRGWRPTARGPPGREAFARMAELILQHLLRPRSDGCDNLGGSGERGE